MKFYVAIMEFQILTNLIKCGLCEGKFHTLKAKIQHLANAGCMDAATCWCGFNVTSMTASLHLRKCPYLGKFGCVKCPLSSFKTCEKVRNHVKSAHGHGKWNDQLSELIQFKMQAQVSTRFAQMQVSQLLERARNNTLKRSILKALIKETYFDEQDAKFLTLVRHFNNKTIPLFSRTGGPFEELSICINGDCFQVKLNRRDVDYQAIRNRLRPFVMKAQGLFSIDLDVHLDKEVSDLASRLGALMDQLSVAVPVAKQVISCMCKCYVVLKSRFDASIVAALVIDTLVTSGVGVQLAQDVWDKIKQHCVVVHQFLRNGLFAQSADVSPIASLATVLSIFGGTMLMGRIPKDSEMADCLHGVSRLGIVVRGITHAWSGLEKLFTFVIRKIFEWQTGMPSEFASMETFMGGVSKWFREVQGMISLHTVDEIARDSGLCTQIEMLYRQGLQFSSTASNSKMPREMLYPFTMHWNVLKNLYEKASSSGAFRAGPRVEPVVIYLFGSSGVGKSGMMYPLATDLMRIDGIPVDEEDRPDVTREIYMRNVEQEYWDGYKNQRVVIYDDFAQIVDSVGNPNPEFMELIRTGNLAPYPLHMATIEEKSKSYFTSRVVICTSNVPVNRIRPESISSRAAVKRRFDMCAEVRVRSQFRTRGADGQFYLDPAKVLQITGVTHSLDVYAIDLIEPLSGNVIQEGLSYKQFARRCLKVYENRFKKSVEMQEFLRQYATTDLNAQILTQEQENILREQHCPVVLAGVSEMHSWDAETWEHFLLLVPEIENELTSEAFEVLSQFGKAPTRIQMQQLPMSIWKSEAGQNIGRKMKDDVAFYYAVGDVVIGIKENINSRSAALVNRLRLAASGFLEECGAWLFKIKRTIKEHPYLTLLLALIPVLFLMLPRGDQKKNYDHNHEGLQRGKRIEHSHTCLWCSNSYTHVHKICSPQASIAFKQLCGTCSRLGVEIENTDGGFLARLEKAPGEYKYRWTEFTLKPDEFGIELTSSGDPRIQKREKLVTEEIWSDQIYSELQGSGDVVTRKVEKLRVEAQLDPNAMQLSHKIVNNIYNIATEIDNKWVAKLKLCFIIGRIALTPAHLIKYLENSKRIKIWNGNVKTGHIIDTARLRWHKVEGRDGVSKDQMLIEFPSSIHDHPDLTGSIASGIELTNVHTCHGVLISPNDNNTVMMRYGTIRACDQERSYVDKDRVFNIRKYYEYRGLETRDGDCGAVLVGVNAGIARKILGIHVAGGTGVGISSPLNIEDLRAALKKFHLHAQVCLDVPSFVRSVERCDMESLPKGDFVPLGKVDKPVTTTSKTTLRPSAVWERVTPAITAPSRLEKFICDGVVIDPKLRGLEKAGVVPPQIDQTLLEVVINDVERVVNANIDQNHRRVLTNMEAVRGDVSDPFLSPINRRSSPGYPLVFEKQGMPGKTRWLGNDEYYLDENIESQMEEMIQMALQNKRSQVIWTDTLKDERRPKEKVHIGKTRVFSAGPMVFTLVFRKYFLGFAAHCARNRIDNEISVGTNVYSVDWTRTAMRLQSKGEKVIAGDFSNFDGTLVLDILYALLDVVNRFYADGEENAQVRHILWKEIINSVHLNGDDLYLWTHSQPSGCPITAILNSLYNSASVRYVWMLTVPPLMATMKCFHENVSMVSYGDDNCINIHDRAIDYFNQQTIAEGYATIGMKYTDEAKSDVVLPFRKLQDISYLKRKFVWNEDEMQFVAPLDLSVVLEMINWIRGDQDVEEKTIANMETSAFELSLHGKNVFEQWINLYRRASADFFRRPLFLTFYEYRTVEAQKYGQIAACSF